MSFPIDVIALDRGWRVRRVWEDVVPRRILCPSPLRRIILELAAGRVEELHLRAGDQLAFTLHS